MKRLIEAISNAKILLEKMSQFKRLQKNKVALTPDERKQAKKAKAVWGNDSVAVWKAVDKKGKTTYVTHTHRAFNTASTLKGAIGRFHKFIKGTA